MENIIKFLDLFAGIGGIKLGFEMAGFKSVLSNDIDLNCKITFDYNFKDKLYIEDISNLKDFPEFDLLTAGFPCQPFSIAGYRKGFSDNGRGDLFFEIIRILKENKPKAFLLENVKNLKTHDNGNTLKLIYNELEKIGYYVKDSILNTMHHSDIPQNRERIFIVGFLSEDEYKLFNFPNKIELKKTIHDCIIKEQVNDKYYYNEKPLFGRLKNDVIKKDTVYQWRRKYVRENKSNVCPTLTANMGTGGHNVPIIIDDYGIRKLTPRECANFQGFPEEYIFPKIADFKLYKQIGNSVTVPLINRIAINIKNVMENK